MICPSDRGVPHLRLVRLQEGEPVTFRGHDWTVGVVRLHGVRLDGIDRRTGFVTTIYVKRPRLGRIERNP
jgi:hypothetical protein